MLFKSLTKKTKFNYLAISLYQNYRRPESLVFMDFLVEGAPTDRIIIQVCPFIQLSEHIVPKTCANFKALITGTYGKGKTITTYKGSPVTTIMPGNYFVAGKMADNIYKGPFFDENYEMKHDDAGILSMWKSGKPDSNHSEFLITLAPLPQLDGKSVAFGKVVSGLEVLLGIEDQGSKNGVPKRVVSISNTGEIPLADHHHYIHGEEHHFDPIEGWHRTL